MIRKEIERSTQFFTDVSEFDVKNLWAYPQSKIAKNLCGIVHVHVIFTRWHVFDGIPPPAPGSQLSNNYCDYCKYIWRDWPQYPSLMRNPGILSVNNEILCKIHVYICKKCNKKFSYTYYNILFQKCYNCIKTNQHIC